MILSLAQSSILSKIDDELKEIEHIPHANTIGYIMYSMITVRPNLAYSIN